MIGMNSETWEWVENTDVCMENSFGKVRGTYTEMKFILNLRQNEYGAYTSGSFEVYDTDSAGDDEANLLLSTQRAKSVYDFLIFSGVASARLSYEGFGEQKPLETNMSDEGRSYNRRTEFYIVEK